MQGWYCEEKLFASQSYGPKVNPPHKIMQHAQKIKKTRATCLRFLCNPQSEFSKIWSGKMFMIWSKLPYLATSQLPIHSSFWPLSFFWMTLHFQHWEENHHSNSVSICLSTGLNLHYVQTESATLLNDCSPPFRYKSIRYNFSYFDTNQWRCNWIFSTVCQSNKRSLRC